jgi:excisionase family DNA binding protein
VSTHATGSTSNNHLNTAEIADLLARLAVLMSNHRPHPEIPESQPIPTRVLLTIEEAAEKLGIGRTLMCKLIRTGEVESVLIGRLRRVHINAVNSYAERLIAEQRAA